MEETFENVYSYSIPVKISEQLALKLQSKSEGTQSKSRIILPDLPVAKEQPYRENGLYVDKELFQEIQRQAVVHEVHARELNKELQEQLQPFKKKQKPLRNLEIPLPMRQLHQCIEENSKTPLKCHQMTTDFVKYVEKVTQSKI